VRDKSSETPRRLVFFRTKEAEQMTAAFSEFAAKTLNRKHKVPSVHEKIANYREATRNAVRDKELVKERSELEL
jgi:hypothetical protein